MIKKLDLVNFRNYEERSFEFGKTTLIVGPNASGKTNILEAIYALAIGKSFRAELEKEVIRASADSLQTTDYSKVARVEGQTDTGDLGIIWDNRQFFKRLYKVNGVGKRQLDFVGLLRAVLFRPEDIEIVIGPPVLRRRYLDSVLSQVHKDYRIAQQIYEKVLRQRNRLLWRIKNGLQSTDYRLQLEYWDKLLIENGVVIQRRRKEFIDFINVQKAKALTLDLDYDQNTISAERLEQYKNQEVAAAATLVGPHRDDVIIYYKLPARNATPSVAGGRTTHELGRYGSRGEQRLGTFTLKLGELAYIESITRGRPILLLDDIFSELDAANRRHILEVVPLQQTIITTTDIHQEEEKVLNKLGAQELRLGS